jgi:hypothetical protein
MQTRRASQPKNRTNRGARGGPEDRLSSGAAETAAAAPNGNSGKPGGRQAKPPPRDARTKFSDYVEDIKIEQPKEQDFLNQTEEELQRFLNQSRTDFFTVIEEFRTHANIAGTQFKNSSDRHEKWRKWSIIATGGLAALNGFAAFELIGKVKFSVVNGTDPIALASLLSAFAAIYAVILTILGNLENFFNAGEKAAGFRQSRDLFLTTYRVYLQKWLEYVEAFGYSPRACVNAARLYRELVRTDENLRNTVKELTEIQPRNTKAVG